MNELNLGSIKIPINGATKTFAILAKRGAGKSYTGAVMAEEMFKNNIPFVVFDPIDVWWGLKLNKDGKSKGLPVIVFGIEHADIKLEKDMGRKIARAVVKHNISCVISTFGLPKTAQRHLIAEFSDEILNINNTPRHIFIEEAHEYVPQRVFGDMGKVFNSVSNLVVMGRNRGLGVTLINQRASTINKDVLTQLDSLLAFRNVAPQDRKALKDWVEFHTAEGDFDKFMDSLPSLPTGTGWIWSPEFMGIFQKIKIRERETFHPDREKLGINFEMPQLESTDVQDFINEFAESQRKDSLVVQNMGVQKKARQDIGSNPIPSIDYEKQIIALKNEYETKIMQKDLDIRKRDEIINQIRKLLGVNENNQITTPSYSSNNLQLWLNKFTGGEGKILRILAENPTNAFTRQQLVLMTGFGKETVRQYVVKLKRALVANEKDSKIRINPNL
jgi:hypothetical protein